LRVAIILMQKNVVFPRPPISRPARSSKSRLQYQSERSNGRDEVVSPRSDALIHWAYGLLFFLPSIFLGFATAGFSLRHARSRAADDKAARATIGSERLLLCLSNTPSTLVKVLTWLSLISSDPSPSLLALSRASLQQQQQPAEWVSDRVVVLSLLSYLLANLACWCAISNAAPSWCDSEMLARPSWRTEFDAAKPLTEFADLWTRSLHTFRINQCALSLAEVWF
jgi:hypothetical protein